MILLRPDRNEAQLQWRTLMVLGFLLVAAGELAFCCITMGSEAAARGPLGTMLLGAAALQLYAPDHCVAWDGHRPQRLAGAAYLAAGAWLAVSPATWTADPAALLLASCFIGGGAMQIHPGLARRQPHPGWIATSGGITVLLGGLMGAACPRIGIKTMGEIAGLELFVAGAAYLRLAWTGWRDQRADDSAAPPTEAGGAESQWETG